MTDAPVWTPERLEKDRQTAIGLFRAERLDEPLTAYLEAFDRYRSHVEELLEATSDLAELEDHALAVLTRADLLEAFRYLAAPPVSGDDLQVLAEAPTLSKGQLRKNPEYVRRLTATVRKVLDCRRFVWVPEHREPTEAERAAAVMASAALLAASRVQTARRTLGKTQQETRVKEALSGAGLKEVGRRPVPTMMQAPRAGEFCGESLLGLPKSDPKADKGRLADIVLRLWDHRLMPIECKVSNSSLNSLKRLNNDAAVKAGTWKRDFGLHQVVPAAVLSGVYDLHNLLDAQERGLTVFWAHDLAPLIEFVDKTRT